MLPWLGDSPRIFMVIIITNNQWAAAEAPLLPKTKRTLNFAMAIVCDNRRQEVREVRGRLLISGFLSLNLEITSCFLVVVVVVAVVIIVVADTCFSRTEPSNTVVGTLASIAVLGREIEDNYQIIDI